MKIRRCSSYLVCNMYCLFRKLYECLYTGTLYLLSSDGIVLYKNMKESKDKRSSQEKPARLQVNLDEIDADEKPPQTGNVFNIWFLKWSGGDSSGKNYVKLKYRVNIRKDSGYTKAVGNRPICFFFAKGCCYLGKKCPYYHRLPTENDYFMPTQDCFGRTKTTDYRDDMDGVGSLHRRNRTLYIGGLHMEKAMENKITKHFQDFGRIEKIRVLYNKNCGFLTYKLESEAQFAKEAMQNQSLDDDEILHVRWANEDPNPEAQREEKEKHEEASINTVKRLLAEVEGERVERKKVKTTSRDVKPPLEQAMPKALPAKEDVSSGLFDTDSLQKLKDLTKSRISTNKSTKIVESLGAYSSSEDE